MSGLTPYYETGQTTLYLGDVREVLRDLPADSVDCVVTSPPYWSLRDYGIEPSVWGGEPRHQQCSDFDVPLCVCQMCVDGGHEWGETVRAADAYGSKSKWQHEGVSRAETPEAWAKGEISQGQHCQRCGAWRGALGLEPTPALFVAHMVEVFREVRRVLKPTGTAWVNLGDSYAGSWGAQGRNGEMASRSVVSARQIAEHPQFESRTGARGIGFGLKPKDLVGIPWRVAFALQEDGWWLRQDIIWAKPNPMPESVTDRCTKSHEYLFLLSKRERYYYDADAIRESSNGVERDQIEAQVAGIRARKNRTVREGVDTNGGSQGSGFMEFPVGSRNKRSVWTVATAPFPDAHFATFPPDLIKPCILAGCPPGGVVLDPFMGSGTTGMVANELGRRAVGIDLNPKYLAMAKRRVSQMGLLGASP